MPSATMDPAQRDELLEGVRKLARERFAPRADEHDRTASFPSENFRDLHEAGLMVLPIPRAYGGLGGGMGGDHLLFYRSVYEIAKACGSTALIWGHHAYIAGLVTMLGNEEQKQRYFGAVRDEGALFASLGSEASYAESGGFSTIATPVDGGYRVSGRKRFASGVGHARFHLLWAALADEPDGRAALIFPIVEADNPRVRIERDWDSMGMRATATDTLVLEDCFVPDADILGAPGAYFDLQIQPLLFHTEFAANFTGIASGALEFAVEYVRSESRPYGRLERAGQDPYIQYQIGELYALREAALAQVERAAGLIQRAQDAGGDVTEAALAAWSAKVVATTAARTITSTVFQICGARSSREKWNLDRFWRDATTFTLHDPVDQRRRTIGAHILGEQEYQTGII